MNKKISGALHWLGSFVTTFLVALVTMLALLFVGVRLAGINLFNVESGSMSPKYPVNSLVFVKKVDPSTIKEGDVITYVLNDDGMLVTHRVIEVDKNAETFITKGDANNVEDAKPVSFGNTVGKVVFAIPHIGAAVAKLTAAENRPYMIAAIIVILLLSFIFEYFERRAKKQRERLEAIKGLGSGDEPPLFTLEETESIPSDKQGF